MTATAFGGLLRHHRRLQGLSQLALALRVETTTRHLSYVENGRSRPGRELVLRLADALELPLRSRNELLAAAGPVAEFPAHAFSSSVLLPYRRAIQSLVAGIRTIGMTIRFGPSRDVTLEEMEVDVLYPRDEEAERWFRGLLI